MSGSFREIQDAIANAIRTALSTTEFKYAQVEPRMVIAPSELCIDVYPGTPFYNEIAFGHGAFEVRFTVRARLTTADSEGAQNVLLDLLDPRSAYSVVATLSSNQALAGNADSITFEGDGTTGFQIYEDAGGQGSYLGCQWSLLVTL